ncbi:MAG: hypothetical protein U0903_11045 [Planctomycetales bacterium]
MNSASSTEIDLADHLQRRNLMIFGMCTGLIYLSAPVLYVGVMQATLCEKLYGQKIDVIANLPKTMYLAATVFPIFIAWLIPYVRALKGLIAISFGFNALAIGFVGWMLLRPDISPLVKIWGVILQGTLSGCVLPAAVAFMWEVLGRGVRESRRGLALALGFGVGPFLAFFGSLLSQVILEGRLKIPWGGGRWELPRGTFGLPGWADTFPGNYALLFCLIAPCMGIAAVLSCAFVVPLPEVELKRLSFRDAIWGGVWDFLRNRVLFWAACFTMLAYAENLMDSNLALYTKHALAGSTEDYSGLSNALRFFVKGITGLCLGWLLTRTSPRTGLLVTSGIYLLALVYGMLVTGPWYLLVFGLYGAGELVGVYAPNYILSASPPENMRRNMAFTTMLMAPISLIGPVFGGVSQYLGEMTSIATGYRLSFALCAVLQLMAFGIAWWILPPRPGSVRSNSQ